MTDHRARGRLIPLPACAVIAFALNVLPYQALPARAESASSATQASELYLSHCAACHGPGRLGAMGPALFPENLGRLRGKKLETVIRDGRQATQMQGFGDKLSAAEISALADWLRTEPSEPPRWDIHEIRQSHTVFADPATLSSRPLHKADPLNLFVIVETGDHHITLLDGDTFKPVHRFQTHFALHGGPKFSPDGRFVYLASRDGWITKYDLYNMTPIADIRVAVNTRNVALSSDGKYVLAGNTLPPTLALLNAKDLSLRKLIPVTSSTGTSSRVSAVYEARPRKSFVVALKDIAELWEISYAPAEDKGKFIHDYRPESGDMLAVLETFPIRRIKTETVVEDFFFDPDYRYVVASSRGRAQPTVVIDLASGQTVARPDIPGLPHLGSGISWSAGTDRFMATPNLANGDISVLRMSDWTTVATIPTNGPGFFMRSHEQSPFAWADSMMSKHKDTVTVIEKETMKVHKVIQPTPGKTTGHAEFTKDGRYVLVSVSELDGEIVVYDGATLEEVKRISLRKPLGKYNVFNKTRLSEGTSH